MPASESACESSRSRPYRPLPLYLPPRCSFARFRPPPALRIRLRCRIVGLPPLCEFGYRLPISLISLFPRSPISLRFSYSVLSRCVPLSELVCRFRTFRFLRFRIWRFGPPSLASGRRPLCEFGCLVELSACRLFANSAPNLADFPISSVADFASLPLLRSLALRASFRIGLPASELSGSSAFEFGDSVLLRSLPVAGRSANSVAFLSNCRLLRGYRLRISPIVSFLDLRFRRPRSAAPPWLFSRFPGCPPLPR